MSLKTTEEDSLRLIINQIQDIPQSKNTLQVIWFKTVPKHFPSTTSSL